MPTAPRRPCSVPRCPGFAEVRGRCRQHAEPSWVRPSAHAAQRLPTQAWMRLRAQVLRATPSCAVCGRPAEQVDHIVPLSQGGTHAVGNLRAICRRCHATKTAREWAAARRR